MKNYKPVNVYPLEKNDGWRKLTGDLPVKMTNDYLFRALLQSDNETLKALLAALLRVDISEIKTAVITNPILLGEAVDDKIFILDVKVELNNSEMLNLEMQVMKEAGWEDRSLSYICRMFDQLNQGGAYTEIRPVRQIAICDFTLFEDYPEFYTTYKLVNVNNGKSVYSEKFIISNVDLTRPDLATEEDKEYGLDKWCRLFKAKTWEELKMLTKEDKEISNAVSSAWQLIEEENIREQCIRREQWLAQKRWEKEKMAEQERTIREYEITLQNKDKELESKDKVIENQDKVIESKERIIAELERKLAQAKEK